VHPAQGNAHSTVKAHVICGTQITTPAALTLLHRWPLGQTLLGKQLQSLGGPAQPGGTIVQK